MLQFSLTGNTGAASRCPRNVIRLPAISDASQLPVSRLHTYMHNAAGLSRARMSGFYMDIRARDYKQHGQRRRH